MNSPTIACRFEQTESLGVEPTKLVAALQEYIEQHLCPGWGCHGSLVVSTGVLPNDWSLIFADDSDQATALGYHELEGAAPRGFVFVRTSQQAGERASVTASHELAELLLDPACNLAANSPRSRWVAREVCDPVQGSTITVQGLPMANFVLPSWYGAGGAPYDAAGVCQQPWEVLPGGYVPVWDGQGWSPLFASQGAKANFTKRGADSPLRRVYRRRWNVPRRQETANVV